MGRSRILPCVAIVLSFGMVGSAGCADQVDILFVIDNSGSMSQHKDNIVAAFGLFVAEMVDTLGA